MDGESIDVYSEDESASYPYGAFKYYSSKDRKNYFSEISEEVKEWNIDDGICWVSKTEKVRASPSLRNCYTTTDNACCNYVEDKMIGDDFSLFIPGPCVDNS